MESWLALENVKKLKVFLGIGYYTRSIKSSEIIGKPLTNILLEDQFRWSEEAQKKLFLHSRKL